jgi:hypothetical protein
MVKSGTAHVKQLVSADLNQVLSLPLMSEIDKVIEKHGGWPGAFMQVPLTRRCSRHALPPFQFL